jgi:hypothetical protein
VVLCCFCFASLQPTQVLTILRKFPLSSCVLPNACPICIILHSSLFRVFFFSCVCVCLCVLPCKYELYACLLAVANLCVLCSLAGVCVLFDPSHLAHTVSLSLSLYDFLYSLIGDQSVKRRLAILEQHKAFSENPLLLLFKDFTGSGTRSLSGSDQQQLTQSKNNCGLARRSKDQCVFCKTTVNLSWAHVIPGNPHKIASRVDRVDAALSRLGKPFFAEDYDFVGPRNLLRLCGSKSQVGTCHYKFDHHFVGVLYDPFKRAFRLHRFEPLDPEGRKTIYLTLRKEDVYTRGLALHALAGIKRYSADVNLEVVTESVLSFESEKLREQVFLFTPQFVFKSCPRPTQSQTPGYSAPIPKTLMIWLALKRI